MISVCAKLQTEAEKILPFASLTSQDLARLQCPSYRNLMKMDFFWARVNNVAKHNKELEEEKRCLIEDNSKLQELVRRYCKQNMYEKGIGSLQLCTRKTATNVKQEASHMVQTKHLNPMGKKS